MRFMRRLSRDQTGATAIEYALICMLIALAAIIAMQSIGNQLSTTFDETATYMAN